MKPCHRGHHTPWSILVSLSILIGILLVAEAVPAGTWLPLQQGLAWSYEGPFQDQQVEITGRREIGGESTVELTLRYSLSALVVRNYFTRDEEGDVYLHQASNSNGFFQIFDPPVKVLDVPLTEGNEWSTSSSVNGGPEEIFTYRVLEESELILPYGVVRAIAVAEVPSAAASEPNALRRRLATKWYAEDLGIVRWYEYELSEFDGTIPIESSTWTKLKTHFE